MTIKKYQTNLKFSLSGRSIKFFILIFLLSLFLLYSLPARGLTHISIINIVAANKFQAQTKNKRVKKYRRVKRARVVKFPEIKTDMISLGGNYFKYQYDEPDNKAVETAQFGSLYSKIQFRINYLLLGFMGEGTRVESDYKVKSDGTEDLKAKMDNDILRFENTMGFTYAVNRRFHFTAPYIGIGFRYWRRKGEFEGVEFNDRYDWFYIPAGFKLKVQPFHNFIIGLDASLRPIIAGRATIFRQKNWTPDNEDVARESYPIFKLKRGWCYRGELDLEFYLSESLGITLTPWYDYVSMGQKETKVVNMFDEITISRIEIETYGVRMVFNIYL